MLAPIARMSANSLMRESRIELRLVLMQTEVIRRIVMPIRSIKSLILFKMMPWVLDTLPIGAKLICASLRFFEISLSCLKSPLTIASA